MALALLLHSGGFNCKSSFFCTGIALPMLFLSYLGALSFFSAFQGVDFLSLLFACLFLIIEFQALDQEQEALFKMGKQAY